MAIVKDALNIVYQYMVSICDSESIKQIENVLRTIAQDETIVFNEVSCMQTDSYREVQETLSTLNEREAIRKSKGVYYTPTDVVRFIVGNSIKLSNGELDINNIQNPFIQNTEHEKFCKQKTVFDPACGAGEFLLAVLEIKFDAWDKDSMGTTSDDIEQIVETICGNDINEESTIISKLRLYLCAVNRYGEEKCRNVPKILNTGFSTYDYVVSPPGTAKKYDLIIGNPPYVEDSKSGLNPSKKYGNIYANVLVNAAKHLKKGGAFGFIIPLSYVATPRMKALREDLYDMVPEQYILSYSDRPDCLFTSVHQKLCILLCRNNGKEKRIYTGNYQYWYREERVSLFTNTTMVRNHHVLEGYIPKLGTETDISVFEKITKRQDRISLIDMSKREGEEVFLNMRAAFWIKAFRNAHKGSEYKTFYFDSKEKADYIMCILNASLFWWYWVCVSDCWHITRKELLSFMVPQIEDYTEVGRLAQLLERRLEETKEYVGTVQTEYEYKHKLCVPEIHEIDDYVNALFGLTEQESEYIKKFAYVYRVSGGIKNEGD